jgi:aminoglycoside phosphotransferase (APT) family kinase protein
MTARRRTLAFDPIAEARCQWACTPSRDELLEHYSEASGRQVDDIDYDVILAKWKQAIVLEQGFQRAGDDEKLQAPGPIVLDLMQSAAELAETNDNRS